MFQLSIAALQTIPKLSGLYNDYLIFLLILWVDGAHWVVLLWLHSAGSRVRIGMNRMVSLPPEPVSTWPLVIQWSSLDTMAAGLKEGKSESFQSC